MAQHNKLKITWNILLDETLLYELNVRASLSLPTQSVCMIIKANGTISSFSFAIHRDFLIANWNLKAFWRGTTTATTEWNRKTGAVVSDFGFGIICWVRGVSVCVWVSVYMGAMASSGSTRLDRQVCHRRRTVNACLTERNAGKYKNERKREKEMLADGTRSTAKKEEITKVLSSVIKEDICSR